MLGRVKKTNAYLKHTPRCMVAKYEQLLSVNDGGTSLNSPAQEQWRTELMFMLYVHSFMSFSSEKIILEMLVNVYP